jgi:hypothetical protein
VHFPEAAIASLFFLAWAAAVNARGRWLVVGCWCVVGLTVGETAFSVRQMRLTCRGADFFARYAELDLAGSADHPLRVLPDQQAGLPGMPLNTALLQRNAHSMLGYASAAPQDMATVFDLDMHGYPVWQEDLRWSRLPAIFGVTHVVMPEIQCLRSEFRLDPAAIESGVCSDGFDVRAFLLEPGHGVCAAAVRPSPYGMTLKLSAQGAELAPALYLKEYPLRGPVEERRLPIKGPGLRPQPQEFRAPLKGDKLERRAQFYLNALDPKPVEIDDLQVVRTSSDISVLETSTPDVRMARATATPDGFVLRPAGGEAVVARPIAWGDRPAGEYLLEVEARTRVPTSGPLVVDLYGADYDPDEAQLTVPPVDHEEKESRTLRRVIRVSNAPAELSLRVYLVGRGVVEFSRVTLSAWHDDPVTSFDPANLLSACGGVSVDGRTLHLTGPGELEYPYHLPRTPITLSLGFLDEPKDGGLTTRIITADNLIKRNVPVAEWAGSARYSHTFAIPTDTDRLELSMSPWHGEPLKLRYAAIRDPCRQRDYERVRELPDGLMLHRVRDALPRVYAPRRLRGVSDLSRARNLMRDAHSFVPGEVALVDTEEPLDEILAPAVLGETYFGDEQVVVHVQAPAGETFLVVNDHYDEYWRAAVDGEPTRVFRTNGVVRGVRVPQGNHVVVFWYQTPLGLWAGAVSALLGLIIAVLMAPRLHRRVRRWPLTLE